MSWFSRTLACPRCASALSAENEQTGLIRCAACGPYPLLGGVPILVVDPFTYCAQYRDSILAALAEHELADRTAVTIVDAFARGHATSAVFSDDWTAHEASRSEPPALTKGAVSASLHRLFVEASRHTPGQWYAQRLTELKKLRGTVLEVGCGAGVRSEVLGVWAERLLISDRSLRAVLQARRAVRAMLAEPQVEGLVLDAQQLPIRRRALDLVLAENVIDLLEAPEDFLASAHASLKKGGALLLTTPEPSLGSDDDGAVERLAKQSKFKVAHKRDGLPWLRQNSSRFVELYLVQALALRT